MITRIVKLSFEEDKIDDFLAFFDTIKSKVANFDGCLGMRLMQEKRHPNIVFTYSNWINENALETYRISETFDGVWTKIKPWFKSKAEAWTTSIYFEEGFQFSNQSN